MADQPISRLPVALTLTGLELVPVVQNGVTKQAQVSQLANAVSPGKLITSAGIAGSNILFQYSDGTSQSVGPVVAQVAAGTATRLGPTDTPTVTNSGSAANAVFNFGIPAGQGVNAGGLTNQVLAKRSNADYDTQWITTGGVSNASLAFDTNNNPIGIVNPKNGLPVGNLQQYVPATNDYAGILAAYNAAVAAGGGVV